MFRACRLQLMAAWVSTLLPLFRPALECLLQTAQDWFQATTRSVFGVVGLSVSLVLQPFAPVAFTTFFATTASADFSLALAREISPGKVLKLSTRAARLYTTRLSETCRISLFLASSSPASCLTVGSCSCGRVFVPRFLRKAGHPALLALPYGSVSLFPNISFLMFSFSPCRAH